MVFSVGGSLLICTPAWKSLNSLTPCRSSTTLSEGKLTVCVVVGAEQLRCGVPPVPVRLQLWLSSAIWRTFGPTCRSWLANARNFLATPRGSLTKVSYFRFENLSLHYLASTHFVRFSGTLARPRHYQSDRRRRRYIRINWLTQRTKKVKATCQITSRLKLLLFLSIWRNCCSSLDASNSRYIRIVARSKNVGFRTGDGRPAANAVWGTNRQLLVFRKSL